MDQTCFALPVLPGKTDEARAFLREAEYDRRGARADSRRRIGLGAETWYLQETPRGALLLGYLAGWDLGEALARFAAADDGFARWFGEQLADLTGLDLHAAQAGLFAEQLARYDGQGCGA